MARRMNLLDALYVVLFLSLFFSLVHFSYIKIIMLTRPSSLQQQQQARGLRNANVPTKARVTYFQEKSLTVDLMYKKEDEWTPCFEVPNIKLPAIAYLGFSAETGELSDNHDIVKVETKNLYSPSGAAGKSKDYSKSAFKPNPGTGNLGSGNKSQGAGWGWFMLKFVLFGLALTGAYVGFTVYRANKRRDRF
jgi:mannose-binding lectin 2